MKSVLVPNVSGNGNWPIWRVPQTVGHAVEGAGSWRRRGDFSGTGTEGYRAGGGNGLPRGQRPHAGAHRESPGRAGRPCAVVRGAPDTAVGCRRFGALHGERERPGNPRPSSTGQSEVRDLPGGVLGGEYCASGPAGARRASGCCHWRSAFSVAWSAPMSSVSSSAPAAGSPPATLQPTMFTATGGCFEWHESGRPSGGAGPLRRRVDHQGPAGCGRACPGQPQALAALCLPKSHPCWSGSMPVLVEDAAEAVASVDVEAGGGGRLGDR